MTGRTKDFKNNRQKQCFSSLKKCSADFLLSRIKYLIYQINFSLALIDLNHSSHSYVGVALTMDEETALQQELSEFFGILFYMERKHRELLLPYRSEILKLRIRFGVTFP